MSFEAYVAAFAVFDLTIDADEATTAKAYKKLAVKHHPDKNPGDYDGATKKFQEIGAAYETCQTYFAKKNGSFDADDHGHFHQDDEVPLDDAEAEAFFEWLYEEMFKRTYSRRKAQEFRNARAGGAGGGVYTFTETFAERQERQAAHETSQRRHNEEYARRVREFERECAEEEKERKRAEKEFAAQINRATNAQGAAYQAIMTGYYSTLRQLFTDFELDVNKPEGKKAKYGTMLHAAAQSPQADAVMVQFLLEKGADCNALNRDQLTPYQTAVRHANVAVAKALLTRKDVHPSRASPTGLTPLQLAIQSGSLAMVFLVVKDATVHDVQRCYERPEVSTEMKEVLRTKRGFVDQASLKAAQEVQRQIDEANKAARLEEEERRAEINRQKKEERRIRAEVAEVERRRKAEEERRREEQAERERRQREYEEELERRQREEEEAETRELERLRREQEAAKVRAAQEQQRVAEARARVQEERRKKEVEDKRLREEAARIQAKNQRAEERRQLKAERQRMEEEQKRLEAEVREMELERQRIEEEEASLVRAREQRKAEEYRMREEEARLRRQQKHVERPSPQFIAEEQARLRREADEERLRRHERLRMGADARQQQQDTAPEAKSRGQIQRERRQQRAAQLAESSEQSQAPVVKSKSQMLRERRQQLAEEPPEDMTAEQRQRWERRQAQSARDKARAAQLKKERLEAAAQQTRPTVADPEDIQTVSTDDLFDRPKRTVRQVSPLDSGIAMSPTIESDGAPRARGRGRGGYRGRAFRGRGRGRGEFRGVSTPA